MSCLDAWCDLSSGEAKLKKVCLIRLSSLGDIVMTSALFPLLRSAGWEIHFVTKSPYVDLLRSDARIQSVYGFDKRKFGSESLARADFFHWLKSQNFSLIIDLHDSWRTWFWRFWLRQWAPVLVVKKPRLRELAVLLFRLKIWGFRAGGRVNRMQLIVANYLNLPVKNVYSGNFLINKKNVESKTPYFVLAPGSAWNSKRWPQERFSELVKRLSHYPVIVLGSEKEEFCDEIAAASPHPESRSLRGKTSSAELLQIIQNSAFVVGNDTGIVHIADAFGIPTVVIEGPTAASLGFSPGGANTHLVGLDLLCRPCSKSGKFCWRGGTRKCLNDLPVSDVLQAVEKALRK